MSWGSQKVRNALVGHIKSHEHPEKTKFKINKKPTVFLQKY